jgi:hypothetical protein
MADALAVSMAGGTIRRKLIHRERFKASVLHFSEIEAVLAGTGPMKYRLTTPSLLSSGTRPPSEVVHC